ncbi:hypothetical protein Bbelb_220080 [Branchiostoma belcheri]|nr:hypothetical protein Bbelb_220080 [Branchiostoma belcheri]
MCANGATTTYGKERILAKPRFVKQTQPIEDGPPNIKMEGNDSQQANKDNITRPTNLENTTSSANVLRARYAAASYGGNRSLEDFNSKGERLYTTGIISKMFNNSSDSWLVTEKTLVPEMPNLLSCYRWYLRNKTVSNAEANEACSKHVDLVRLGTTTLVRTPDLRQGIWQKLTRSHRTAASVFMGNRTIEDEVQSGPGNAPSSQDPTQKSSHAMKELPRTLKKCDWEIHDDDLETAGPEETSSKTILRTTV